MTIRQATLADIPVIHQLANEIWRHTYKNILSEEQLDFMLNDMYSENALAAQFNELIFLVAERMGAAIAFAAISETDHINGIFKLHKIYILPSEQGKGTGKKLIGYIEELTGANGATILELNVHRANPALGFYKKLGFAVLGEVDIPYHQFTLTDYILRKSLV